MNWRFIAILTAVLVGMALVIAFGLWIARSTQETLGKHVAHVRHAFAELAAQMGLAVIEPPMAMTLAFPSVGGAIRGRRVDIAVDGADEEYRISITVQLTPGTRVMPTALEHVRGRCLQLEVRDYEVWCSMQASGRVNVDGLEMSRIVPSELASVVGELVAATES